MKILVDCCSFWWRCHILKCVLSKAASVLRTEASPKASCLDVQDFVNWSYNSKERVRGRVRACEGRRQVTRRKAAVSALDLTQISILGVAYLLLIPCDVCFFSFLFCQSTAPVLSVMFSHPKVTTRGNPYVSKRLLTHSNFIFLFYFVYLPQSCLKALLKNPELANQASKSVWQDKKENG